MSEKTNISWCDSTLNFWEGCTKVSAGCANCYAEARDKRFHGGLFQTGTLSAPHWGKGAPRRKSKGAVKDAFKLNRKPWICDACGEAFAGAHCHAPRHRRRIFSLSLGDWLDPEVPIEWLAEMLDTIRKCDQVVWILCSKRPELWRSRIADAADFCQTGDDQNTAEWLDEWHAGKAPKNIILLASVENQAMADKRIPELLRIPAVCHGLSCEPLLGPVKLFDENAQDEMYPTWNGSDCKRPHIGWIIVGGESGPNARPCNVEWIRSLVEQGKQSWVAAFVKQLGANPIDTGATKDYCITRGYGVTDNTSWNRAIREIKKQIKHPNGGDPSEWVADLRVQQFPKL